MRFETLKAKHRILALEVRSRATGFVVFEMPRRLLDWGRRKHGVTSNELPRVAAKRIAGLLDLHEPSVVIVRTRTVRSLTAQHKVAIIIRAMQREAKKRSVPFQKVSARTVRKFFTSHDCTSKNQSAGLLVRWFPALSWKLPPKRKMWKSEHHRMVIFDAAATAIAFMSRSPPTE